MAAMPVKGPDGGVISAEQVHRTHLGSLNGFLATVTTSPALTGAAPGRLSPGRAMRHWTDRTVAAVFLASVLVTSYGYFSPFGGGNANSRLSLIFAVLDDGTLRIDSYHAPT